MFNDISLIVAVGVCYLIGVAVTKIKLPAILGFLIGGMLLGPYAMNIVDYAVLEASWYQNLEKALECVVGLMIGEELVWSKLKKSGKVLIVTTGTSVIEEGKTYLQFASGQDDDFVHSYKMVWSDGSEQLYFSDFYNGLDDMANTPKRSFEQRKRHLFRQNLRCRLLGKS